MCKTYTLYPSPTKQLLDVLGLYRLPMWPKPRFGQHRAVAGIDLRIIGGERVGVIGRNGAGKTTLLKMITGSTSPSSGELVVNGDVQALMQVGMGFHPEFTGRANIRASLLYSGLSNAEREEAETDIIEFCELGEYLDQPLKTYSMGMQSRLQFACATSIKPEILIVDEILGAGDAYFSVKSSQRMERLTKSGCTLLLVSHSMAQILQFCERCIWIDGGTIVADGPARDVVGQYEVHMENLSATRLGTRGQAGASKEEGVGKAFRLGRATNDAFGESAATDEARYVDVLENGARVYRWPGDPGPKLASLQILHEGEVVSRFPEGAEIAFRIRIRNERPDVTTWRYQVTVLSLDNRRITRLLSPVDETAGSQSDVREVLLKLDPCLLQAGEYFVNFALLPAEAMKAGVPLTRYDLVSRFCDFEITRTIDYRERCIFTHPAHWEISGPATTAIALEIAAS